MTLNSNWAKFKKLFPLSFWFTCVAVSLVLSLVIYLSLATYSNATINRAFKNQCEARGGVVVELLFNEITCAKLEIIAI